MDKNSYISLAKQICDGKIIFRKTYIDRKPIYAENFENSDSFPEKLPCIVKENNERVLYESFSSNKTLIICGGGHISVPVSSLAKMLGYRVIVFEDRQEFAEKTRFKCADDVICGSFADLISAYEWDKYPDTSVVIVTRGHIADTVCLREVINRPIPYIGMIGSKRKNTAVFELLRSEGICEQNIKKVHAPIGLDIGAETPEEIAIAIAGELIQARTQTSNSQITDKMLKALLSDNVKGSVMATIVTKHGSTPRDIGARMLYLKDGSVYGTIGGGLAEYEALNIMKTWKDDNNTLCHFNMSNGQAGKSGMICGGEIDVIFEVI